MRGRGEVVDVGDAELNMRYATRERYQRLLAQDDVMCMCVHDCDGGSQRAPRRKFEIPRLFEDRGTMSGNDRRRMRTKGCICSVCLIGLRGRWRGRSGGARWTGAAHGGVTEGCFSGSFRRERTCTLYRSVIHPYSHLSAERAGPSSRSVRSSESSVQ